MRRVYTLPISHDKKWVLLGLERDSTTNSWSGFGGGIEKGETVREALTREMEEESLGLLRYPARGKLKVYPVTTASGEQHGYAFMRVAFEPTLPDLYRRVYQHVHTMLPRHHTEKTYVAWVRLDQLRDLVRKSQTQLKDDATICPKRSCTLKLHRPMMRALHQLWFGEGGGGHI